MGKKTDEKAKKIRKRRFIKKQKSFSVSRIKSYYGFSKEYPGVVDEKGFRDVSNHGTKSEIKQKSRKITAITFVGIFLLTFLVSYICRTISNYPVNSISVESNTNTDVSTAIKSGKSYYLNGQFIFSNDMDKYVAKLKEQNTEAVILDAKDGAGYLYFKCDDITSVTASAIQYQQSNYSALVQKFTENSISASALFSCFADTFEASYNSDLAVMQAGADSLWYDNSPSPHAWLNPYNTQATDYILKQIDRLAESGVSEIILTDAQIPPCTNFNEANFGDGKTLEAVNKKMADFVKTIVQKYNGKCKISVYTSFEAVLNNSKTANALLDIKISRLFVDMRLSIQPENMEIDTNKFTNPAQKPYMFISNAVYSAASIVGKSTAKAEIVPVIEYSQTASEQEKALKSSNINTYCIYDRNSQYAF